MSTKNTTGDKSNASKSNASKSNASKSNASKSNASKSKGRGKKAPIVATILPPVLKHANGAAFTTQRPGVVGEILNALRSNGETGLSKADVLAFLVAKFPERDATKMKSTVSMQVPSGLRIEKRINVTTTQEGKYFISDAEWDSYANRPGSKGGAKQLGTIVAPVAPVAPAKKK